MSDDSSLLIWRSLCEEFAEIAKQLDRVRTINVNARNLRDAARQVAERYLHDTRAILIGAGANEDAAVLDDAFGGLFQLSHGHNALASYKKQIKRIRKTLPNVAKKLAINVGASSTATNRNRASIEEQKLAATLEALVPSAGLSYKQALADLNDEKRVSFRGPASELREALREALDALAPDDDVMKSDGFKLEEGKKQPTTKQKVRFILRARGLSKSNREVPEDTANAIDELIGHLTRSVQNLSSIATHVATEKTNVRRVKRYIDAVLHDILEIK
jgi:hypothetical protein